MRWNAQDISVEAGNALPGLAKLSNLVRSVQTPGFDGITFHEVLAKSALNKVHHSSMPFGWTINPYRGCSHACVYCFARSSHTYLNLDAGVDFDSQIVVKINVADVLVTELTKPTWKREPVALGTNTDPYQRAEGKYRLMPGIIEALTAGETPFSILTKGSLLRRDLPALARAKERVGVDLAMSIAIFDDDLQQSIEPGTPSTAARLATVSAARELGFDVAVFMMPILPFLTDTDEHLERALRQVAQSGAASVTYSALHLRPGIKEWYAAWLHRNRPDLVPRYRDLYGDQANAPKEYRRWLAGRVKPLIARHGLRRAIEDPATGGVLSTAATRVSSRDANGEWRQRKPATASAPHGQRLGTPTLF